MRLSSWLRGTARERAIEEATDAMVGRMLTEREHANAAERKRLADEIKAARSDEAKLLPPLAQKEAEARAALDKAREVFKAAEARHSDALVALQRQQGEIGFRIQRAEAQLREIAPDGVVSLCEELRDEQAALGRKGPTVTHPAGKLDPLTMRREPAVTDWEQRQAHARAVHRAIREADDLRMKGDVDFDKEVKRIRESVPA